MYDLPGYGLMIADSIRMTAYLEALRRTVKPGDVVIDIGTGPGIMAIAACQFGATKVYAIEPDNVVQIGREIAAQEGYQDRITFIQAFSTATTVLERADVIVSDLRGILPLFGQHLPSIIDARTRLLAPGGVLIPQQDRLWAAVVNQAETYESMVSPWEHLPCGIRALPARQAIVNSWRKCKITPDQLLVEPQLWQTLDYLTLREHNYANTLSWTIDHAGVGHGLGLWFDSMLVEGVEFSSRPGLPEPIYGKAFFPWVQPVHLEPHDEVTVEIRANLIEDDYVWQWNTVITHSGATKANFRQSTFLSTPITSESLARHSLEYMPQLNTSGQMDLKILQLMQQNCYSLGEIARQISEHFPDQKRAVAYVTELVQKYSL